MNKLADAYGDKLTIVGVPTNQFGHQTNEDNGEILNTLKYVRPGGGFEPKCTMTKKMDVNGSEAHPLFKFLKSVCPTPKDNLEDTKGNGMADGDALVLPRGNFGGTTIVLWTPVARSDIAWNFEKFLVGPDGSVVQRYSRFFPMAEIAKDIDAMLK